MSVDDVRKFAHFVRLIKVNRVLGSLWYVTIARITGWGNIDLEANINEPRNAGFSIAQISKNK